MKAYSLTKIITFVSILFVACAGFSQGGAPVYGQSDESVKRTLIDKEVSSCKEAVAKYTTAKSEAIKSCKNKFSEGSISDCVTALDECSESTDEELPIFPAVAGLDFSQMGLSGGTGPKCLDLTYSEYNTEKKDLERSKKEIDRELADKEKDMLKDEETYQKDYAELQKESQNLLDEKDKEDLQSQEDERTAEAAEKETLDGIKKKIRELENKILASEKLKIETAHLRTQRANLYKDSIIECKLEAEKLSFERKKISKTSVSSGLSKAASAGNSSNSIIQEKWQNCVQKVIDLRTSEQIKYQNELEKLDKFISDTQAEVVEMKQTEQLLMQQTAQAKIDRGNAKTKKDASYLAKYKALYEQRVAADNIMTQKRAKNQLALQKAQSEANKTSNDLVVHKGSKYTKETKESTGKFDSARDACASACQSIKKQLPLCEKKGATYVNRKEIYEEDDGAQ